MEEESGEVNSVVESVAEGSATACFEAKLCSACESGLMILDFEGESVGDVVACDFFRRRGGR